MKLSLLFTLCTVILLAACSAPNRNSETEAAPVKPVVITEAVRFDTDDPAIWVNKEDPSKSLVLGTDKKEDGALYVFTLDGKIVTDKVVHGLQRPNNVDIEYGLMINGKATDIAVVTERMTHKLRIFSLPGLAPIDNGGIEMFEGETGIDFRDLMGISLYKDHQENIYAIVGRKTGPTDGGYLWQYQLADDGQGAVKATLIRKFGMYSGVKEIEAIAVDDELGFVYYSDEGVGVRKYYADPNQGNEELALFATEGFALDHEGISIYKSDSSKGYILVSDQEANRFHIYPREGTPKNIHDHPLLKTVLVSTQNSDGSDVTSLPLNEQFKHGLFVAMSADKTFQFYRWEDIAGDDLMMATKAYVSEVKLKQ